MGSRDKKGWRRGWGGRSGEEACWFPELSGQGSLCFWFPSLLVPSVVSLSASLSRFVFAVFLCICKLHVNRLALRTYLFNVNEYVRIAEYCCHVRIEWG